MTGPPLAQIDSESAPESTDDLLSGLEMDQEDFGELHPDHEESSDDKNLDDYLDQLLEEGFGEPDKEILDESVQQPTEDSTPPVSETPSEDDLDRLFDSLIAEEIKFPIAEEDTAGSNYSPENDQEEKDLDALLDEIILNNLNEEEAIKAKAGFDETESTLKDPEPLTKENEEIDASVTDPMGTAEQKIETPEPENLSPENNVAENSDEEDLLEEDALAEAPPEEKTLSAEDQPENFKVTFEDPQKTAETEPSADQEALKETAEDGDTEEKSEEAAETVDQNEEKGVEESAKTEPSADQQEEGKGAEEIVDAEAVMDSDEETSSADEEADSDEQTSSEEKADSEEEPERNEFGLSEADYENDGDEVGDQYDEYGEDEEESSPPEKKKFAFFTLPSTKTVKLVLGVGALAVLLTGGGAYFALQTLAPPELTQMTKKTSEVPEGLKPKDPQENPAFQNQSGNAPAKKPNPALAAALGSGEAPPLAKDTGNPNNTPSEVESGSGASKGLLAALAPSNHAVQLGTIMPVAYNINDIRVLSFSLEAEMSDAESAQVLREALPLFEKITITTVEQLMDKKFFNDILYVKEKLKKNLQNNFNKILEGEGRVKKITFTDFTVQ